MTAERRAFLTWVAADEERAKYRGAFSDGWEDAIMRKGDYGRLAYPAGPARSAYHAGRMFAGTRKWPK